MKVGQLEGEETIRFEVTFECLKYIVRFSNLLLSWSLLI